MQTSNFRRTVYHEIVNSETYPPNSLIRQAGKKLTSVLCYIMFSFQIHEIFCYFMLWKYVVGYAAP